MAEVFSLILGAPSRVLVFLCIFTFTAGVTSEEIRVETSCLIEDEYLQSKPKALKYPPPETDTSCFVSLENVDTENIRLIDARGPQEFERGYVPGSANIPATDLPYKTYLRNRDILVLLPGFSRFEGSVLCAKLKNNGFASPRILQDGLKAWVARGKPFSNIDASFYPFETISAQDLLLESNRSNFLVVNINDESAGALELYLSNIHTLPMGKSVPVFLEKLEQLIADSRHGPESAVVVVGKTGDYQKVRKYRFPAQLNNIYFLEGGVDGLAAYWDKTQRINKHVNRSPNRYKCAS